jgi:GNAT superfamily N-acetyltransferase
MNGIEFRKCLPEDRDLISSLIVLRWGSEFIVVHNTIYIPANLDGFIAFEGDKPAGLITYTIDNESCEIVSLDSFMENIGIGTKLINLVKEEASAQGCRSLWLITTNDNEHAAEFYRNRGFELTGVFTGAVDDARKIKPEIPPKNERGIPITDELRFSLNLEF